MKEVLARTPKQSQALVSGFITNAWFLGLTCGFDI